MTKNTELFTSLNSIVFSLLVFIYFSYFYHGLKKMQNENNNTLKKEVHVDKNIDRFMYIPNVDFLKF